MYKHQLDTDTADRLVNDYDDIVDDYEEPSFASFLRGLGCCFAYSCLPCFGNWCGSCCYPYKSVNKGYRGVVQEFGRVKREVGEGMHYINPMTEKLTTVNQKIQVIDLQKQNVMTSEKLSIVIDSIVYYKIVDINSALFKVDDVEHSIIDLAYSTLRDVVGKSTMDECLGHRERIAQKIKEIVDEHVHNWGVSIISIQIKDIDVPKNIMTTLSSAVTAEREAQAKIITAEADVKAAHLLRQAADIISTDAAMQIRSLEVIDRLANSANTKIILLPSDLTLQSNLKSGFVANEVVKHINDDTY